VSESAPQQPFGDPDDPSADPARLARRGVMIRLFVCATWALFFAMIGLLLYKWSTAREPSSVAVVSVGREIPNTIAVIDGVRLEHPYRAPIDPEFGFVRFFLQPGVYTLRILQGPEDHLIYETDFTMYAERGVQFDLTKYLAAATQPSSAGANATLPESR
jgi:hypothetical protein